MAEATGLRVLTSMPPPAVVVEGDLSGVYELDCYSWDEPYVVLTPHPVTGVLIPTDHSQRHVKGDLIALTHTQAVRLLGCGAVVVPGLREARQRDVLQQRMKVQQDVLDALERRNSEARAALEDVDLTDEQRSLLQLDLERRNAGAGPSVAPTGPTL